MAVHLDLDPELPEEARERRDVRQVGQVAESQRVVGQQARGEER
jgi:hypothetical protein